MEMLSGLTLVLVLLIAGCTSGGSEPEAAEPVTTPTTEVPTPTAVEPTPAPVELTDEDRIASAMAALEADGAGDLIAWDVLDSSVDADGIVDLTLCGWTGETVFDAVYSSLWTTEADGADIASSELGTSVTEGECLNTELIDSALATVARHDELWTTTLGAPANPSDREALRLVLTPRQFDIAEAAVAKWAADGIVVRNPSNSLSVAEADNLLNDVLWRRHGAAGWNVLELAVCRGMPDGYGFFRGLTLVDDERGPNSVGEHAVDSYTLVRGGEGESWLIDSRNGLSWSECAAIDDWPRAASIWRPAAVEFEVLER